MTFTHALTKSRTNSAGASSDAYTSQIPRRIEFEPEDQVGRGRRAHDLTGGVEPLVEVLRVGRGPPRDAEVEQVAEEVGRQRPRPVGEDAVRRAAGVGADRPQAADEDRHLLGREVEHVRPVHQQRLRGDACVGFDQLRKPSARGSDLGKVSTSVMLLRVRRCAPAGTARDVDAGVRGAFSTPRSRQHDQVGQRDRLAAPEAALTSSSRETSRVPGR
jgi:hypothetical protein